VVGGVCELFVVPPPPPSRSSLQLVVEVANTGKKLASAFTSGGRLWGPGVGVTAPSCGIIDGARIGDGLLLTSRPSTFSNAVGASSSVASDAPF
jgi:hypothetical protein